MELHLRQSMPYPFRLWDELLPWRLGGGLLMLGLLGLRRRIG